jgi:hypothetical protein
VGVLGAWAISYGEVPLYICEAHEETHHVLKGGWAGPAPLWSEHGTCKTATARFWLWLLGTSPWTFKVVGSLLGSGEDAIHLRPGAPTRWDMRTVVLLSTSMRPETEAHHATLTSGASHL